jgi:CRP/FNR family transcriptional regulator
MELKTHLARCYLCSGLKEDELTKIAQIASGRKLHKDEMLFFEGDAAGGFYILLSGRVRVYKASAEGKEYTMHRITPGQLFAEAAIFQGDKFPANAVAAEDSLVAFFPRDDFLKLLSDSPQLSMKIIGSLSGFVREFNRRLEELSLKEVPARIASYLLNLAEENKSHDIILDSSKTELAKRLGTISETVSRNLKKLKELGVIEVDRQNIKILNLEKLSQIADGEKI